MVLSFCSSAKPASVLLQPRLFSKRKPNGEAVMTSSGTCGYFSTETNTYYKYDHVYIRPKGQAFMTSLHFSSTMGLQEKKFHHFSHVVTVLPIEE